jgi:hypothetical protein
LTFLDCIDSGICGDGIKESFEECEINELIPTCKSLGHYSGTVSCNGICEYDISNCVRCGDEILQENEGEICDKKGEVLQNCSSTGKWGGPIICGDCEYSYYNCNGKYIFESTRHDEIINMISDSSGNLIITGYTNGNLYENINMNQQYSNIHPQGEIENDCGPHEFYYTNFLQKPSHDSFIAKITKSGTRLWTLQTGTENEDSGLKLFLNENNDIMLFSTTNNDVWELGALSRICGYESYVNYSEYKFTIIDENGGIKDSISLPEIENLIIFNISKIDDDEFLISGRINGYPTLLKYSLVENRFELIKQFSSLGYIVDAQYKNNNYILIISEYNTETVTNNTEKTNYLLYKLNLDGEIVWELKVGENTKNSVSHCVPNYDTLKSQFRSTRENKMSSSINLDEDGSIYVSYFNIINGMNLSSISKISNDGTLLWYNNFENEYIYYHYIKSFPLVIDGNENQIILGGFFKVFEGKLVTNHTINSYNLDYSIVYINKSNGKLENKIYWILDVNTRINSILLMDEIYLSGGGNNFDPSSEYITYLHEEIKLDGIIIRTPDLN